MRAHAKRALELRRRVYELLEHGPLGDFRVRLTNWLLILLIVVNLVAVALETVPRIESAYRSVFIAIETFSLVVFTVEYLLRIWVAVEHAPRRHLSAKRARWEYIKSPAGLIDLISVLPFWLAFFTPAEFRVILVFRIVRFLKLARYSPALRSLLDALAAERRALFGCLVIMVGMAFIAAALIHVAERSVQPDKFGTIPDSMWWAIVTLGQIGYGDAVPITTWGRLIGVMTIFVGLIMIALPIGIVATAFSEQVHRRAFIVTFGMVARVPLFAELDASHIADIMRLLRSQTVDAGEVIVRVGEPAHSMYFIARGEIDIALKGRHIKLGVGHFFGEIAVLRRSRRSATATALTRADLLVLDGGDLHRLMEQEPLVAERIHAVVRERVGADIVSRKGDIVTEEIEQAREQSWP
jgi:voltage-gated potassium channel